MPGDGRSPYSMTVGHFHSEKVVESFLGELPFAWPSSACGCTTLCVAAANLDRRWIGVDISPKAVELVNIRLQQSLSDLLELLAPTSPRRCHTGQNKHALFGQQQGRCNGCRSELPFRNLEVDHVISQRVGGQDNIENLQLLCTHCNPVKGDRPQEYLVARLCELGIAA